jgi:ABC-type polar amino acid transport system ATPase subunit
MDPEVLLVDEPTSALDPKRTESIVSIFKKLSENGLTIIVVTHDMDFVKKMGSRTVLMESDEIK